MLIDPRLIKCLISIYSIILLISCEVNNIKILSCEEVENKHTSVCIYEHGNKITHIVVENDTRDTAFFSTHSSGALKIVTVNIIPHEGISFPSSGDYFEPLKYGLILPPKAIDTFYICDTIPDKFKKYEYCVEYKMKGQKMKIWASPGSTNY